MKNKLTVVFVLFLTYINNLYAQTLEFGGEIRNRGEVRNGFKKPLADSLDALYVHNLRVRAYGTYSSPKVKARITVQDSKIFSSDHSVRTDNFLGIYEAWGEYAFTPEFSAVAGRQILEYDDNRLFSAGNWSNTPNSHDALRLKYESAGFKVHVTGAWKNASESLYDASKSYESLFFGWGSYAFQNFNITGIWVNEGFKREKEQTGSSGTAIYRNTVGANIGMKNSEIPFSFFATGYYQFGYDRSDKKLDAFLLALKTQYQFSDKVTAILGGDYFSGSKYDVSENKNYTFNKLYGSNHSFNGSMEYWSTLPSQGLIDIYGGADVKVNSKLSFNGSFHTFLTAQEVQDRKRRGIGSGFDFLADYKLSRSFSFQAGWSAYFKNKGTDILKKQVGVDTRFPQWAYLMVTFKPVLYKHEFK